MKSSPWDPKESLPREYARIVQPDNYPAVNRGVVASADTGDVAPGTYVTVHITGAPLDLVARHESMGLPIVLGGMFEHEQKLTVLHANIQRASSCSAVIRSRYTVTMQCGFWRRRVRPVYSENALNCDKHKFDRFLQPSRWTVASVYAPLTFGTNVPVSYFLEKEGTDAELIASGSLMGADPDRIILKKIVLTGFPFRVKKRWAVIRFMFFSPEDVKWFKPVQIYTKMGSSGAIIDSIGTHGRFKCLFDVPIKQNDTVCMSLFKRIYPKPVGEFASLREEDAATSSMMAD